MQTRALFFFAAWLCLAIEIGSVSFLRKWLGIYGSPVVFLLSGILLTITLLKILKLKKEVKPKIKTTLSQNILVILLFAVISFSGWLLLRSYFDDYPIDPTRSDIIPLIKVLVKRFSSGEQVYREINDFGYTMYPNYLPASWMPFWFADQLNLDYRTWAFGLFSACILISVLFVRENFWKKTVLTVLPFLVFLIYIWEQPAAFGWTIEPMIAGFYLLLLFGFYKNNAGLIAASLICCLLSRYAIVLMLPFLFFIYFLFVSKKKTWMITGISFAGIFLLFAVPFLLHQPEILNRGYQYYTQGALAEWKGQYWQQPGELPFQLSQGYGLAIFFYNKSNIEISLNVLQKAHLAICIAVPLILTIWYFRKAKSWLSPQVFLVLALNLYLIVFFAFIQVPYAYLFFTPIILSAFTAALLTIYTPRK